MTSEEVVRIREARLSALGVALQRRAKAFGRASLRDLAIAYETARQLQRWGAEDLDDGLRKERLSLRLRVQHLSRRLEAAERREFDSFRRSCRDFLREAADLYEPLESGKEKSNAR